MAWWWLALAALAAPEDALDPLGRSLYAEGRRLEAQGHPEQAAVRYKAVWERDPTWTQGLIDLGRALEAAGDDAGAERAYRSAPYDSDAVEAIGRLYLRTGRPRPAAESFARLRSLRPEWPEAARLQAQALASVDAASADAALREYLAYPEAELDAGTAPVAVSVIDALRAAGDDAAAAALVEELVARWPGATAQAEIAALVERFALEDEARVLAAVGARPLTAGERSALADAQRALGQGAADAALTLLQPIADANPGAPEVWAALADAHEALGDVAAAETALGIAEALQPFEWRYPARLAEILAANYGGRYDAEAAAAARRAAERPGAPATAWLRAAELARQAGRPADAIDALERYGPADSTAREWLAGWTRERPPPPVLPGRAERPPDVPAAAWDATWLAIVMHRHAGHDHTRLRAALDTLAEARSLAPGFVRAIEAEAAIRLDLGEVDDAVGLYSRSLEHSPGRPEPMLILADLERRRGRADIADTWLQRAADAGSGEALLAIGERQLARWQPGQARATLDRYFAGATGGSPADARALAAEISALIRAIYGGAALLVLAVALVPVGVWARRRSGSGVGDLLASSPASYREIARIASTLRHEVLKHNTTTLGGVADALELGDPAPAAWTADRLYGAGGAVERFRQLRAELVGVGRAAGMRLNLRRDPVFGPLGAAFDRLAALERDLRAGNTRAVPELRALATALNDRAYRELGSLISRVSLCPLDEPLLRAAWRKAQDDPSLRGVALPEPEIRVGDATVVRMYPDDLEDVLVNLARNALQAGLAAGDARIGLLVDVEEDAVTGLETVAVAVADHAPRTITTAAIRGRTISRGLGLAVDLAGRAGGSIRVEDRAGWNKAVTVRLPRAEWEEDAA